MFIFFFLILQKQPAGQGTSKDEIGTSDSAANNKQADAASDDW